MNRERQVRRQNEKLRSSLGERDFPHAWVHSSKLWRPAIALNADGTDQMEYFCSCGVDIIIHEPSCKDLVLARKKVEMIPIMVGEQYADIWVFCRLFLLHEDEWKREYGTDVNFPHNGLWYPVEYHGTKIMLPGHQAPSDDDTQAVIEMVSQGRKIDPAELSYEFLRAEDRSDKAEEERLTDMVVEDIAATLNSIPGTKNQTSYRGKY